MPVCFDTAQILKLYTPEPDSPAVLSLLESLTEPVLFTSFHLTEFANALHCKQGRGLISEADVEAGMRGLFEDCGGGMFTARLPNWDQVFRRAGHISSQNAAATLCRTLNAIHVALALEMRATALATTDARQVSLAKAVRLSLLTP